MYLSFDELFDDRNDAILFAKEKLAESGEQVMIECRNVPDCSCEKCNGLLFDFQRKCEMQIGKSGDMINCFWCESYGLICYDCALKIAEEFIECV